MNTTLEMEGSLSIVAPPRHAWGALNDPTVLKKCIPGCVAVKAISCGHYVISLAVQVGPMPAKFAGHARLSYVNAPTSFMIAFEGQGGAAGHVTGTAYVWLAPPVESSGCEFVYSARAEVCGRIAQVGRTQVDAVAKSMIGDFLGRFNDVMQDRRLDVHAPVATIHPRRAASWKRLPAWAFLLASVLLVGAACILLR